MFMNTIDQDKYNEVFDSVYYYWQVQKETNQHITLINLQKYLDDLYTYEGNDWLGRNELKSITISATIAACELLLNELRN